MSFVFFVVVICSGATVLYEGTCAQTLPSVGHDKKAVKSDLQMFKETAELKKSKKIKTALKHHVA